MSAAQLKKVQVNKVTSINKLLVTLRRLDQQLPGSTLCELAAFNSAYIVITRAIEHSLDSGYFENPKFIENFTVCFSGYYLEVINTALSGNGTLPIAWSTLLAAKAKKPGQLPNFIYLLMGANAHINHDLALVMVKMLSDTQTDNLVGDILQVDKILVKSGSDILSTFSETKPVARLIKERCRYLYLPVIMHLILYWRIKAFKDYLVITSIGASKDRAQLKGTATSRRLLILGRLLS